ncbi:MAG: CoA transferase [Planctomycetes bacterium]|nr:CoA transferase [Planctomycetota bacterium]
MNTGPLDGVLVADFTRILAGPFATMKLGDLGAEVVKVELPGTGDDTRAWGPPFVNGESCYFLSVNRNKRSLTLDLKRPEGREAAWRLVDRADVVVSNFRPGTMERLGLAWDEVHRRNPRAVYALVSGYGDQGPERDRPSYDVIVQGECGLMDLTGQPDGPPTKAGISVGDLVAGMNCVEGVLAALLARGRTGLGQKVDVALLDGMLQLLTYQGQGYFATGRSPVRMGNAHPSIVPYETFKTSDGYINLGVGSESLWTAFCERMHLAELWEDPRFVRNADRVAHRSELRAILAERFARQTSRFWSELLSRAGIPCGVIRGVRDVLSDPARRARDMVVEVDHPVVGRLPMVGIPVKLSGTPGTVRRPPPRLGEHTEEVLGWLGYTAEEVVGLRAGAIA